MEIIFHSHANKTRFHKKGCVPSPILKVRVFGTWKWPTGGIYSLITELLLPLLVTLGIYLFVCWFVYLFNLLFG